MKIELKTESRIWALYFLTILLAVYCHEVGHCIPAWIEGVRAIPTPAKEYIAETIPVGLQQQVSLGGIIGSVVFSFVIMGFYLFKTFKYSAAVLAGAVAMPAMYTFRFILAGRGHDATEFQEAQAALGVSYSGHFLDWLFLGLFLAGVALWVFKSQPESRVAGRLAIGFVLTLIFTVALQSINKAIFDPIFQ